MIVQIEMYNRHGQKAVIEQEMKGARLAMGYVIGEDGKQYKATWCIKGNQYCAQPLLLSGHDLVEHPPESFNDWYQSFTQYDTNIGGIYPVGSPEWRQERREEESE